jgi:ABC-type branched-subunit amino acid transport system ATPase component
VGKSTTINTISSLSSLLLPRSDEILFGCQPIHAMKPFEGIALGITHVSERWRLLPEMTVEDNFIMGSLSPQAKAQRKQTMGWVMNFFRG